MSDGTAWILAGVCIVTLLVWLVTYWHGLRANARTLAEVRRLNAEWRAEVGEAAPATREE